MNKMTEDEKKYWDEKKHEPIKFIVIEEDEEDDGIPIEELHRALQEATNN